MVDSFHGALSNNAAVQIQLRFITESRFQLTLELVHVTPQYKGRLLFLFMNKDQDRSVFPVQIDNFWSGTRDETLDSAFPLRYDPSNKTHRIPRIIHQSYKDRGIRYRNYLACLSWRWMNPNWTYRYWSDTDIQAYLELHFDTRIRAAYDMVYAGAYKSDIFRLCVLYQEGGVWADISSVCEFPLDLLIEPEIRLVVCRDTPSQVTNPNIYQAFLVAEPRNAVIFHVLQLTVDRVLRHEIYEKDYPWLLGAIGVTGPTVFALALNLFLHRPLRKLFSEETFPEHGLLVIDHPGGTILRAGKKIVTTKYPNFPSDRYTSHYGELYNKGFVFKRLVEDRLLAGTEQPRPTIFQIWIQSRYVSANMFRAIETWKTFHPDLNYQLWTNKDLIRLMEDGTDELGGDLLAVYRRLKPYAYKCDLARFYLLYRFGGIYADIDSVCISSCSSLLSHNTIVLCRDMITHNIFNGFLCVSTPFHPFTRYVLVAMMRNVWETTQFRGDLDITGPQFLGKVVASYFKIPPPFVPGNFQGLKLLDYQRNLPIPKGGWRNSCKAIRIERGNVLHVLAKKLNGTWNPQQKRFLLGDRLENVNGNLVGNTGRVYEEVDGSGLVFSAEDERVYLNSKYPHYNKERLLLDGNDFAKMYAEKDILN